MAIHVKEEGFSQLVRLIVTEKLRQDNEDGSYFWLLKMGNKIGKQFSRMVKPQQREEWELINDISEGDHVYVIQTTNGGLYIISTKPVTNE